MTFREKIERMRKGASEAQSASKIIDKLKALKDSNSPDTAYRWIWELIQNAKDVVNSTGLVDIQINFSETNKTIEFSHNGCLFTTENIVFLIEQVSSKERSLTGENKKKSTGKFGTGFLTTHLLSEKVHIYGYLQDAGEPPRSFHTLLDRTGQDKGSISNAISHSCDMLDDGDECTVDETKMNTKFVYELDEIGIRTAISGLKNLLVSVPYVFAFVQELNSITIKTDKFQRVISRGKNATAGIESSSVVHIHYTTLKDANTIQEDRYVFVLSGDLVSIATEIIIKDNNKFLLKPKDELPRIFCDFPLLGTKKFSFPIVVNSPLFNPTEPRDGIPLVQSEREGGDSDENKRRILEAVSLYNTLLDYFSEKGYKGIYNVVGIPEQAEEYWLDINWVEQTLIAPIKEYIKTTPFIYNSLDEVCSLYDEWNVPQVYVMKDEPHELRQKVWKLSKELIPSMMTQKDEIESWYNSLWIDCRNFGVIDLAIKVEEYGNIKELEKQLDCDAVPWLNELIVLFYNGHERFLTELGRHPAILPNQYGNFMSLDKIFAENNIGEPYKDIALIAGIDFRERLLDDRISKRYLKNLQELSLKNVFYELNQVRMDDDTSVEFYRNIINICDTNTVKQNEFVKLAKCLYPDSFDQSVKSAYYSERILSDALKCWRDKMCSDFSSANSIKEVIVRYNFQCEHDVADWIAELANYLKLCDTESLLDKYAILPNQHGLFMRKSEIFLDDGSVDDVLKDAAMYSGTDVRDKMLYNGITLELPSNRIISLEYIAPTITSFVRSDSKTISSPSFEGWETFRATSAWLRAHRKESRVSKCFKELVENIHWFYDDDEISESMAKSEKYDEVLKKYNVSDINQLATILASRSATATPDDTTISISKELLAQWGIASEEELRKALANNIFGSAPIHQSQSDPDVFKYVIKILDRAKKNIIDYLYKHEDYTFDKENIQFVANTIFRVNKLGHEIYIIARPSDFDQVILYYDTEIDLLDFDKDCELWVESEAEPIPKKITLGRILKLTGVNKIPLRSLKYGNR